MGAQDCRKKETLEQIRKERGEQSPRQNLMIKYQTILNAHKLLLEEWKKNGGRVIEESLKIESWARPAKEFLMECTACGGNWVTMLLSGIKNVWPNVWDAIPAEMGERAWQCVLATLTICGVDLEQNF